MLEVIVLKAFAGFAGAWSRILLRDSHPQHRRRDFYTSIAIGIVIGILSMFGYTVLFDFPPEAVHYIIIVYVFFMVGYVMSDLIDTFRFFMRVRRGEVVKR